MADTTQTWNERFAAANEDAEAALKLWREASALNAEWNNIPPGSADIETLRAAADYAVVYTRREFAQAHEKVKNLIAQKNNIGVHN